MRSNKICIVKRDSRMEKEVPLLKNILNIINENQRIILIYYDINFNGVRNHSYSILYILLRL